MKGNKVIAEYIAYTELCLTFRSYIPPFNPLKAMAQKNQRNFYVCTYFLIFTDSNPSDNR